MERVLKPSGTLGMVQSLCRSKSFQWNTLLNTAGGQMRLWSCTAGAPLANAAATQYPKERVEEEVVVGAASVVRGLSEFLLKDTTAWREAPSCPDYIGPVAVAKTSNANGRGLFATKDVRAGTLLLISNPMSITYDDPHRVRLLVDLISMGQINLAFRRQMYALADDQSTQNQKTVPDMAFLSADYARTNADKEKDGVTPPLDPQRIMDIMMVNSFEGELHNLDAAKPTTHFCGLWLIPSLINHSCVRNASRLTVGGAMILHATTDIQKGEEITITYSKVLAPLQMRNEASLAMKFGFICNCQRCAVEKLLEPSLKDASNLFCRLRKQASDEVHRAIFSRKHIPVESFHACMELADVYDRVHKIVTEHNGLSELEKKWVLGGYSAAFLGKWLVRGYTTGFAEVPSFVNQQVLEVLEAMRATIPGLVHTLSLITHLVGIAQKGEGNDEIARKLFRMGLVECAGVYGNQSPDYLVKLMEKSPQVIPFF